MGRAGEPPIDNKFVSSVGDISSTFMILDSLYGDLEGVVGRLSSSRNPELLIGVNMGRKYSAGSATKTSGVGAEESYEATEELRV
jgi:hypothetical protein